MAGGTENELQKATRLPDGYLGHYKPKGCPGTGLGAKRILSKNSINHINEPLIRFHYAPGFIVHFNIFVVDA